MSCKMQQKTYKLIQWKGFEKSLAVANPANGVEFMNEACKF